MNRRNLLRSLTFAVVAAAIDIRAAVPARIVPTRTRLSINPAWMSAPYEEYLIYEGPFKDKTVIKLPRNPDEPSKSMFSRDPARVNVFPDRFTFDAAKDEWVQVPLMIEEEV